MIILVKIVMTAATLCYAAGLAMRHRNNDLHRKLMAAGFILTAGIAVVLVAGVNIFGATYGPSPWLISLTGGEGDARVVLIIHRIFATLTLLLLMAQVYAGIRRLPYHKTLFKAVIPTWLITYISGLSIFI